MRDLYIIVVVAILGLSGTSLLAIAVYFIDKNAERLDKRG